jgi:hypothetical protein
MSERQASFLFCDDLLVSLNGKFFIQGVYTGDIVIATEEAKLNQLVLLLQISTPINKPFRQLQVSITLPGEENPRTIDLMPLLPTLIPLPGRTNAAYKVPVPITFPTLKAGAIEIQVTHEEGQMAVGRQWVMGPAQAQEFQKLMGGIMALRN